MISLEFKYNKTISLLFVFAFALFSCTNSKKQQTITTESTTSLSDSCSVGSHPIKLPDYYFENDYIVERLDTINNYGQESDVTFAFITDMHWTTNQKHSFELLSLLNERCKIDFLVNCGDIINGGTTPENNYKYLQEVCDETNNIFGSSNYFVKGNHDNGQEWDRVNQAWTESTISDEQLSFLFCPQNSNCAHDPNDIFSYYFEDDIHRIRYYSLNTGLSGSSNNVDWFYSTLKTMQEDYYVGVFLHIYFLPSHDLVPEEEGNAHLYSMILNTLNKKTIWEYDGKVYDFRDKSNCVLFMMSGHIHADYSFVSEGEYPIIATTCDTMNDQTSNYSSLPSVTRTNGTYTEQAFDVVHIDLTTRKLMLVRIGGGNDRFFSF